MIPGNLKFYLVFLLSLQISTKLHSEVKINLNVLQPTFEEDTEISDSNSNEVVNIKSKEKETTSGNDLIVKFRALDKITAKTKDIKIVIGEKKRFGYLEIFPKRCDKFEDQNNKGVAAYIQVRDLSEKKEDKVFVFNGWTFSNSTNLRTFDHPIYDLWVTGCENI